MAGRRRGSEALSPGRRVTEAKRRLTSGFAFSLALHALVLAALTVRWVRHQGPESLPPPATVTMEFEGGKPDGPSTPEPPPDPVPFVAPSSVPGGAGGAPPPPPPEAAAPEATPPEPPREQAAQPPAPPPPSPPPPPPTDIAEPAPPVEETPPPKETVEPPPRPPVPPSPPRQTVQPRQPTPAFPAPMDYSFGPPSNAPSPAPPGKKLLSLGLAKRGPEDSSPFSMDYDAEVGPDWRNALAEWVSQHAYYPREAARAGHQGTSRVLVTVRPDGHVISVELEQKSGSQWLDLALEALFRGAKLPPLPKSSGTEPVPFHFTMYYIIR